MNKTFLTYYKVPFLISAVVAVTMLALSVTREPLEIAIVIIGALIGTFALDTEYLIYAYILDTQKDFSKTLSAFIKHGDINNALSYINYNRDEIKDKTLNSALFQVVLAMLSIFVVFGTRSLFAKSLILTVFAQSLYKFSEYYFNNKLEEWFWALKDKPSKNTAMVYLIVLLVIYVFCLYFF